MPGYHIHNSCKFVKGHRAYFVYDLYRTKGYYVTLPVGDYLTQGKGAGTVLRQHATELADLLEKEIIYQTGPAAYRNLVPGGLHESPEAITNLILAYTDDCYRQTGRAAIVHRLIEELGIRHLQIAVAENHEEQVLLQLLDQFRDSLLQHIELVFAASAPTPSFLEQLCANPRVQAVMLIEDTEKLIAKKGKVYTVSRRLYLAGQHPLKFSINKQLYDESQHHHTYFHKKLYIDAQGNLGNAPEYPRLFMNIFEDYSAGKVWKTIASKAFRKYWDVRKDDCLVCRDCEFRHMCVDRRLPHKTTSGAWAHRETCNYDPYTNTWKQPPAITAA